MIHDPDFSMRMIFKGRPCSFLADALQITWQVRGINYQWTHEIFSSVLNSNQSQLLDEQNIWSSRLLDFLGSIYWGSVHYVEPCPGWAAFVVTVMVIWWDKHGHNVLASSQSPVGGNGGGAFSSKHKYTTQISIGPLCWIRGCRIQRTNFPQANTCFVSEDGSTHGVQLHQGL